MVTVSKQPKRSMEHCLVCIEIQTCGAKFLGWLIKIKDSVGKDKLVLSNINLLSHCKKIWFFVDIWA